MALKLECGYLKGFIGEHEYAAMASQVENAHALLASGKGPGNDFLGWVDLPTNYDKEEFARIKAAAERIKKNTDVFIVIGTTTEPAIAFRVFREILEKKYGKEEAKKRIFCTTDKARGTLKHLADEEGYETFVVPDDVGGRYSVLTAVGLLPIAVAGADIDALMAGAQKAQAAYNNPNMEENDCYKYAAIRNILYNKGKTTEVMVSYEPCYTLMNEWWKQLYGESEGKDGKGLFPASVVFSTDLHSMGQYIQDGRRSLFETVMLFEKPKREVVIGNDLANVDGLNFLEGKSMAYINRKAFEGTVLAHNDGGVPNVVISAPDFSEDTLGQIIYFFEKACAISGYLLGVNPFNQPGVESYKKNMFALLGKPGYEGEKEALEARLSK